MAKAILTYVALPPESADVIAVWIAHTYVYDVFEHTPRLHLTSPAPRCGKTTTRDVIGEMVCRPLSTENLSRAVLFRVIESSRPTLLADEVDAWLGDNEELRGLLNAGHKRNGQALRCEGEGNEVRAFNVFAPAVLCGIGSLPGTLHDRSIIIRLDRAKRGEVQERFDSRRTAHLKELARKLARFCTDSRTTFECVIRSCRKLHTTALRTIGDRSARSREQPGATGRNESRRHFQNLFVTRTWTIRALARCC